MCIFLFTDVGFIFVVFPAAVDHFDLPLIWSIIFFIMILLMGLSTTITVVETVVTAIQDEFNLLRTKSLWRIVVLSCVCCVLFIAGLPLTTRVRSRMSCFYIKGKHYYLIPAYDFHETSYVSR